MRARLIAQKMVSVVCLMIYSETGRSATLAFGSFPALLLASVPSFCLGPRAVTGGDREALRVKLRDRS